MYVGAWLCTAAVVLATAAAVALLLGVRKVIRDEKHPEDWPNPVDVGLAILAPDHASLPPEEF